MLSALAAAALLAGQIQIQRGTELPEPGGKPARVILYQPDDRLDPPKIAPRHDWEFDWLVKGFVQMDPKSPAMGLRMRVFSQEHRTFDDPAPMVARMAMRLWEHNLDRLHTDHAAVYGGGVVDFYLCFGGKAGGEQFFGEDSETGQRLKANLIFIYDLASFKSPLEMAREVAHEYGHATLVPIGGYTSPEPWANGYLGEKLFMRYLRDELAAKRLTSADAMGAELPAIDKWVRANVDPLVLTSAARNPFSGLKGTDTAAMNAFLGLVLLQSLVLPNDVFARSLVSVGSTKAIDYPSAVLAAARIQGSFELTVPSMLKGKSFWIPLGKGAVKGASIVTHDGGWAKISPIGPRVRVTGL